MLIVYYTGGKKKIGGIHGSAGFLSGRTLQPRMVVGSP